MDSYLLFPMPATENAVVCEGMHSPDSLTRKSGIWIHAAGKLALDAGLYAFNAHEQWILLAVEEGDAALNWRGETLALATHEMCFLPPGPNAAALQVPAQIRCLWFALDGALAPEYVRKLGALEHAPLPQRALPTELTLIAQIAEEAMRRPDMDDTSYRLQHLMYGLLTCHWGQPICTGGLLSNEIFRVIDTLRTNRYRDNLSLAQMAQIAQMPVETFRKRFVSEVGIPPLSYALHCKMERAKELLREPGCTVYRVGNDVGIHDPYRFSKQFKSIVGISPSAFMKRCALRDA